MRLFKKAMGIILSGAMVIATLCGCGKGDSNKEQTTTEAATYKITFMNGETTLGTADVKEGSVIDSAAYKDYEALDGAEFLGWFETPTFLDASKKDLTTATFAKDTTLYGSYKMAASVTDERVWYVVGTSENGLLKDSAWAGAKVDEETRAKFEMKATGNATNEFAITIDLYNGDQLQVIHDWAWEGQKGYGCFTDLDATMFENGGGLGGNDATNNVNVIMDGNYTITITTNPEDEAHDTITITRNGDIQ